MKVKNFLLGIAFLVVMPGFFSCAKGKNINEPLRSISVVGTSSIYVNPDTAVISFSVSSLNEQLETAKLENDKIKKSVSELFKKYNIVEKNISINGVTVYPKYNYVQGRENFIGYEVNQNYTVHINDLSSYENFISELLKSGIKSIHNVNFTVENTKEYADKARQNALKIATEKAELLCVSTADKHKPKLGKLISISEDDFVSYGQIRAMNMKEEYSADTASDNFGQIQIKAKLNVVFELEY